MKAFVVLLVLAQTLMPLVLAEIPKERYDEIHKICVGKSGVSEAVIDRARKGDFENSDSLKQFMVCIMEEENCIVDGKISEDQTVAAIPPAFLATFEGPVRDCVKDSASEANLIEAAFKMTYCVYTKTLDKFFIP